EQTAQSVAPASPVRAEFEDDPLTFGLCRLQGLGDLLIAIGRRIVKLRSAGRFCSQKRKATRIQEQAKKKASKFHTTNSHGNCYSTCFNAAQAFFRSRNLK